VTQLKKRDMKTPYLDNRISALKDHIEHMQLVTCLGMSEMRKRLTEYEAIKDALINQNQRVIEELESQSKELGDDIVFAIPKAILTNRVKELKQD
jgi:hypothetical protein